jgi:hypothetical protein
MRYELMPAAIAILLLLRAVYSIARQKALAINYFLPYISFRYKKLSYFSLSYSGMHLHTPQFSA